MLDISHFVFIMHTVNTKYKVKIYSTMNKEVKIVSNLLAVNFKMYPILASFSPSSPPAQSFASLFPALLFLLGDISIDL